jgi:polyhydroxyalkanoate synthase
MKMLFSMPDEFATGWLKAGFNFLRALPVTGGHGDAVLDAQGEEIERASSAQNGNVVLHASINYWLLQSELWSSAVAGAIVARPGLKPVAEPERGDRRFHAEEWSSNGWHNLLKQNYLINSRMLEDVVESTTLDEKDKHKLRFFTRQFIDLASPSNIAATNPEVIRQAVESNGSSLLTGFTRLLEDIGQGAISITDQSAFRRSRIVRC